MNSWKSVFAMGIGMILVIGCGPTRPDGIPKLYPATVTVQNGASPIAEANILLVAQGGGHSGSWAVAGITNASGVAVITTSQGEWRGNGAPEGEYRVYITKLPDVHQDPLPEELINDSDAIERHAGEYMRLLRDAPKIIPDILTDPSRTPLTLVVSISGRAELSVDVSEHQ